MCGHVGGGGGTSKTGILNKVVLLKTASNTNNNNDTSLANKTFQPVPCALSPHLTDSVKCVAFHPSQSVIACGVGNKCILLSYKNNKYVLVSYDNLFIIIYNVVLSKWDQCKRTLVKRSTAIKYYYYYY